MRCYHSFVFDRQAYARTSNGTLSSGGCLGRARRELEKCPLHRTCSGPRHHEQMPRTRTCKAFIILMLQHQGPVISTVGSHLPVQIPYQALFDSLKGFKRHQAVSTRSACCSYFAVRASAEASVPPWSPLRCHLHSWKQRVQTQASTSRGFGQTFRLFTVGFPCDSGIGNVVVWYSLLRIPTLKTPEPCLRYLLLFGVDPKATGFPR